MDTAGFDSQEHLNELEEPLASLRPVTVGLSRDRMLFEAGRDSARAIFRGRFLTLAAATLVVVTGLGLSLIRERSNRHSLEVALAGLEGKRTSPPYDAIPPVSIASNEISPYSQRALSLLAEAGSLDEWSPSGGDLKPDRPPTGAETEPARLRVRDAGTLLQF